MSVEFAVSSEDPTTLVAAQWYQAYSSDPRPAPTSIDPGSSDGIAYQSTRAAPVQSSLVYSAVSLLTKQ